MDPSTIIWDDTGARRNTLHEMLITVDMGKANRSSSIGFEFDPSRFRSKMNFLKRIIKWVVLTCIFHIIIIKIINIKLLKKIINF